MSNYNPQYTVLFQRDSEPVVDATDYNCYLVQSTLPDVSTKKVQSHDFLDQSGEDAYIAKGMAIESYDHTLTFAYKGANLVNDIYKGLLNYLRGKDLVSGTGYDSLGEFNLKYYDKYTDIGHSHVYVKSIKATDKHWRDTEGAHMTFELVLTITEPDNYIKLNK